MACLLRAPGEGPGIVVLTTQERDHVVRKNPRVADLVHGLKGRWLVGLHHNWHDHQFHYDPLYDFSMAGEGDLVEAAGKPIPLVPFDACNFVPNCFASGASAEKFWDVLYVARAVFFKRIPEFLACIRVLYDRGEQLRVLFLCPEPPEVRSGGDNTVLDVRKLYEPMFSAREKDLFTLIATDVRYPFPFDLETLAFFYRSSRVFVHFASDERRCRVAAYAWASGMPVVAMASVGSLLPEPLRRPPHFFEARSFADFPSLILRARRESNAAESPAVQSCFQAAKTVSALDAALARLSNARGFAYREGRLASMSLDIRLGRHHMKQASSNSVDMPLKDFLQYLTSTAPAELSARLGDADPESVIAQRQAISAEHDKPGKGSILSRLRRRIAARVGL
jgi:hypothetical protein